MDKSDNIIANSVVHEHLVKVHAFVIKVQQVIATRYYEQLKRLKDRSGKRIFLMNSCVQ